MIFLRECYSYLPWFNVVSLSENESYILVAQKHDMWCVGHTECNYETNEVWLTSVIGEDLLQYLLLMNCLSMPMLSLEGFIYWMVG